VRLARSEKREKRAVEVHGCGQRECTGVFLRNIIMSCVTLVNSK